jgi:hypothetical protein
VIWTTIFQEENPMKNLAHGPTAAAAALLFAALSTSAYAHGSMKPQHGGIVQMSGETVVELVSTARGIDVYVTEEDEPVAASGVDARLTVTAGGQKTDAALAAQPGNRFSASGLKVAKGSRVVVALVSKSDGAKTFTTFQVN